MNGEKLTKDYIRKASKLRFDPIDETFKETLSNLNLAIQRCSYSENDKFIKLKQDFCRQFKTHFSLLSLNINGLSKKIDDLEIFLDTLQFKFDVIGITETHLNSLTEKYTKLKNYKSFYNSRNKNSIQFQFVFN